MKKGAKRKKPPVLTKAKVTTSKRVISRGWILDNGKVVSHRTLMKAAIPRRGRRTKAGQTQEIRNDRGRGDAGIITPPLPFDQLAILLERNTSHYRAVKAKAGDTAKRGWFLEADERKATASEKNFETLMEFFRNPSAQGQSLDSTLENYTIDFESIGNAGIELVKDMKGTPLQMNHIPAMTLFRTKDPKVYLHRRGTEKVYFKAVGDERKIDSRNGKENDSVSFQDEANELIYSLKYHPRSDWYGLPDVVPAIKAVVGDIFQRDFNLDFFENGAVPAYMVIIEGAELSPELETLIEDFFKHEIKGSGNNHKTLIIPIPIPGVSVKIERVSAEISESSFKIYHEQNIDEILSANGVPGLRAFLTKPGSFGRDQSREINKIYKESIITPLQKMIEAWINEWIVRKGFGITDWAFKLVPLAFDDRELVAMTAERLAKTGSMTVNELRRFLSPMIPNGLDPIDGGDVVTVAIAGIPTPIDEAFPNSKDAPEGHQHLSFKALTDLSIDVGGIAAGEWDGAKQEDIRDIVRTLNPIVKRFVERLKQAFAKAERQILANMSKEAPVSTMKRMKQERPLQINAVLKDFDDEIITEIMREEANVAVESGVALAARKTGIELSFGLQRPATQLYLDQTVAPFSRKIAAGISNRVRRQLSQGIAKGEPLTKLRDRVKKVFAGVKNRRALLIARTETARAHNIGTINGYNQTGVVKAVRVSDGTDFDEACVQADGQEWPLQKASAEPIEHPNCVRAFIPITIGPGERRA